MRPIKRRTRKKIKNNSNTRTAWPCSNLNVTIKIRVFRLEKFAFCSVPIRNETINRRLQASSHSAKSAFFRRKPNGVYKPFYSPSWSGSVYWLYSSRGELQAMFIVVVWKNVFSFFYLYIYAWARHWSSATTFSRPRFARSGPGRPRVDF